MFKVDRFKCIKVVLILKILQIQTYLKNGLSESELEDLLSLDDIVLNDVYQYHLPPMRRIPPLLWTRIRNDLPNYLTERDANGVNAMNWYHKQFREASIERYFETESNTIYFHSSIADYFLGIWGGGINKPFKYTLSQKQRFNLTAEEGNADRKVPSQPLAYHSVDGRIARYNLRKLELLPFHLIRAKRFEDLFKIVLFDYNWLHSKLNCFPLQSILSDFEDSLELMSTTIDRNILREISLVADSLRLAAPVVIQYPNMIGPQIIARLLPLRHECPNIDSLLRQCDQKSPFHCALLPVNHCLHTPGGPLMYSLEGHQFAVFDFSLTSDFRYVVSVSNRFLMWDLSTGEVSRDIDPEIKGIMQSIIITIDDKFAITYTNYNEIIILNIISGEVDIIGPSDTNFESNIEGIALNLNKTHFIVWTSHEWIVFDVKQINNPLVKKVLNHSDLIKMTIITIDFVNDFERHMIYKSEDNRFFLETVSNDKRFKLIEFSGGFSLNSRKTILFIGDKSGKISFLRRRKNKWSAQKLLSKEDLQKGDELLAINIYNEKFLVGFYLRGFRIWTIDPISNNNIYLQLPAGVRNITLKPLKSPNAIIFTKHDQYAIAGIRKHLYIWSMQNGDLLKSLEAHYGRISQMKSLIVDELNAIVSASFDKSIRVWNVKNLFERVHTIDRMELSIDSISFSSAKNIAITVTRNCIGIWSLDSAKLWTNLSDSKIGAIVTHALITDNGKYIISIESGNFLIWDLENGDVIYKEVQNNVKHLLLADNDTKVITIEIIDGSENNTLLINRSIPDGKLIFKLSYFTLSHSNEKMPVLTKDNQYIAIPMSDISMKEMIGVYRLQDGFLMHIIKIDYIKFSEIIAIQYRGKETVVGLIGNEFSYIMDIYTQRILNKITRWNGQLTSDGNYGLFAPSRGGLELIDLKYGSTVKVLLPQTSEGVLSVVTSFTATDEYVYYYHSVKKIIRLIRLEDGKVIANYKVSAEAKVIKSTPDGKYLVVGGVDGSFIVLMIVDPNKKASFKQLNELPSRVTDKAVREKNPFTSWKMAAKLATMAAKSYTKKVSEEDTNSKLCTLS
jgi:WD40 repeat protein